MEARERIELRVPPGHTGLTIGDGWLPLVDELDRTLAAIDPDYVLHQGKEKFGGLRYYVGFRTSLSDEQRAQCTRFIREAEEASMRTCELCGQPGAQHERRGWIVTRCSQHGGTDA